MLRPVFPQNRKSPSRDLGVENEGSERQRARERLLDHRDRHLDRRAVNPGPGSRGRRVRLLLDGRRRAPLGEALRRRRRAAHLRHRHASGRHAKLSYRRRLRRTAGLTDLVADGLQARMSNFRRLVLGCIDSYDSEQRRIL